MLRDFLKEAAGFSTDRVLWDIGEISRFHRIQGSKELPEAAKFVAEELRVWGIDATVFEETYNGRERFLTLVSPIAWDLIGGEVELPGRRMTVSESPLLVMAHSPAGEAEGEVIHIASKEDWEKAEGKIVLVGRDWREAYRKANEMGASTFIAYREGTGDAFPYIGLFLRRADMKWARIPAVTLPESVVKELLGKLTAGEKVVARVKVDAVVKERETLPMVYAEVGQAPYILLTAHLCHPMPGANDNASGSAMLIELARVLSKLHSTSFRFGFAFLWMPEYYGSQAFIERYADPGKYYVAVNLDMVGGSPEGSGSTLMLVRPPLSRFSAASGILEYFLDLSNSAGKSFSGEPTPAMPLRFYPYEMGSDHDVFNIFGVPSMMPITWPDRFYHSSADAIDKVSGRTLGIIGRAVLAALLALSRAPIEEIEAFSRAYALKYIGELGMKGAVEVAPRLVLGGLHRDSKFLGFKLGRKLEERPWLRWKLKGILSPREIEVREGRFRELTRDRRIFTQLHELLMLGEILPEEATYRALAEEFGACEEKKLRELVSILEENGIVEVVS